MKGRKTKELRPGEEEALRIVQNNKPTVSGATFKPGSGPATRPILGPRLPQFKKGGK